MGLRKSLWSAWVAPVCVKPRGGTLTKKAPSGAGGACWKMDAPAISAQNVLHRPAKAGRDVMDDELHRAFHGRAHSTSAVDCKMKLVGWVERSETHRPSQHSR